jgi:light-regulated signal transduction histidine kinase (bacteriophytochrome)
LLEIRWSTSSIPIIHGFFRDFSNENPCGIPRSLRPGEEVDGIGLGLSLVKEVLRIHSGRSLVEVKESHEMWLFTVKRVKKTRKKWGRLSILLGYDRDIYIYHGRSDNIYI